MNANAYTNNVVHRSEPGFVIQGGGFSYPGTLPLVAIAENAMVANEPVYSNVRGTIAMAKLASNPNSATNQWFISLADNSANLDTQNGGFTAFGQVTGNGMSIVDAIAALSRFNMGGNFTSIPLRNFTTADATAGTSPNDNNLVLIRSVVVLNANPDSAASLTPARNTLLTAPPANGGGIGGGDGGGGGGSVGLVGLLAWVCSWWGAKPLVGSVAESDSVLWRWARLPPGSRRHIDHPRHTESVDQRPVTRRPHDLGEGHDNAAANRKLLEPAPRLLHRSIRAPGCAGEAPSAWTHADQELPALLPEVAPDSVQMPITRSDTTATMAGTAKSDMTVVSRNPAVSAAPIMTGASSVPARPTVFAHPIPGARMAEG